MIENILNKVVSIKGNLSIYFGWTVIITIIFIPIIFLLLVKNIDKQNMELYTTVITVMGSFILLVLGYVFNPIATKRHKNLIDILDKQKIVNDNQHQDIFKTLTEYGKAIKDYNSNNDLLSALRNVINEALIYSPSNTISQVLNFEGELFIKFCDSIVHTGFMNKDKKQIEAKVYAAMGESLLFCTDNVDPKFANAFAKNRDPKLMKYLEEVYCILDDTQYNSKRLRFKIASECYLQEHLTTVIKTWINLNI